jgi:hypothetical protein
MIYNKLLSTQSDEYFGNVSSLITFDGTNNQTTNILDSSTYGGIYSCSGGAKLSSTTKRFGSTSLYISGFNSCILTPAVDKRLVGDFTIEHFVYNPSNVSEIGAIVGIGNESNSRWSYGFQAGGASTPNLTLNYFGGGYTTLISSSFIPSDSWFHLAVVRVQNNIYGYINGILRGSITNYFSTEIVGNDKGIRIGDASSNSTKYIDELRITNGVSRYKSNFVVPTEPFTAY